MKVCLALLSSFAIIGALSGSADDVLPRRFNFDRYTAMVANSPFAVATAVALPEATPNFAKDLFIANAARSSEGDMVTVMSSSDHNFKKYLTTREPVDGYSIAQIDWSEDVGKTKVTISKEGQFATLTFNQSLLSKSASAGPLLSKSASAGPPLSKSASAGPPIPYQMPQIPSVSSSETDEAAHARKRSMIQQKPTAATIPHSNFEESRPNLQPRQQIDVQEQFRQDLQRAEESAHPQHPKEQESLRK